MRATRLAACGGPPAPPLLAAQHGPTPDQDCDVRIVERALEEPLRCIVANAGDEPPVVMQRVEDGPGGSFGCNVAMRTYGDLMAMGVIDSAKVTRLALQDAASIASLLLTTDRRIARRRPPRAAAAPGAALPEELQAPPLSAVNGAGAARSSMALGTPRRATPKGRTLMTPLPHVPPVAPPRPDCLVVANAARARVFERDGDNGALREIADALHPASREKASALGRDRPGRVRKSAASTAFAPRTAVHEREQMHFAHELGVTIEQLLLEGRLPALVLMASNPFLGELKAALGPLARARLKAAVALDLTSFQGAELEQRATRAWADAASPAG